MAELLPCPFCGGKAEIQRNCYEQYFVVCKNCKCVMWAEYCRDAEQVKSAWNTRTPKERGWEK